MAETDVQELEEKAVAEPESARAGRGALKFGKKNEFQSELRRRVDEFFEKTGRPRRDVPQMYLKTAILLTSFVVTYVLLVFAAQTWWQGVPLAIFLGLI